VVRKKGEQGDGKPGIGIFKSPCEGAQGLKGGKDEVIGRKARGARGERKGVKGIDVEFSQVWRGKNGRNLSVER